MMWIKKFIPLVMASGLAGCTAVEQPKQNEEFVMPRMQQNTYLSHAEKPERFGFHAVPVDDGHELQGSAQLKPGQVDTIKLAKGNIPLVTVRGPSRWTRMTTLLDSSSPKSWMEFGTSQKFGATFLGEEDYKLPYIGTYNTGDVPAFAAVVSKVRIGSLTIENVPFYIRMALNSLGPVARGFQVPHIDSVLGYDFLKTFEFIQFDYHKQMIRFSSGRPYSPDPDLLMTSAKIVDSPGHGLAVEGGLMGTPTTVVLDVAGDYFFSRGDVKVTVTKQVSLGDVVYRKVPTLLLPTYDAPPRAGRRMLEKYTITICPKKGIVYFERFPE